MRAFQKYAYAHLQALAPRARAQPTPEVSLREQRMCVPHSRLRFMLMLERHAFVPRTLAIVLLPVKALVHRAHALP